MSGQGRMIEAGSDARGRSLCVAGRGRKAESSCTVKMCRCDESTVTEFGIIIYSNLLFLIQCLRTPKSESKVTTLVAIMF